MILTAINLALFAAAAPVAPLLVAPAGEAYAPLPRLTFQDPVEVIDPHWTGAITVGISLADGNTDEQKASASADAVKELERARWTLGFSWNYSEEGGLVTQRKTFGKAQYDHTITERLYWLLQTSIEGDESAGVDLRTTLGGGIGYQLIDGDKFKLRGEVGPSWFNEELEDGTDESYLTARVGWTWTYVPSDRWAFEQSGAVFPSLEDSEDVYSKLDTRVKATLTENMFAQLQWVWDWDNTPAAGNDRSDNLYLITVGWSF